MFANSSLVPKTRNGRGYNNAGWIASLQEELRKMSNVDLAISCIANHTEKIQSDKETTYYLVSSLEKGVKEKILGGLMLNSNKYERIRWKYYEGQFLKVINDYNPDIIHIFGSEFYYGLVASITNKPVVLHIQGILNCN